MRAFTATSSVLRIAFHVLDVLASQKAVEYFGGYGQPRELQSCIQSGSPMPVAHSGLRGRRAAYCVPLLVLVAVPPLLPLILVAVRRRVDWSLGGWMGQGTSSIKTHCRMPATRIQSMHDSGSGRIGVAEGVSVLWDLQYLSSTSDTRNTSKPKHVQYKCTRPLSTGNYAGDYWRGKCTQSCRSQVLSNPKSC